MNRRGFNLNDPFEIIMLIMGFVVIVGCCAFGEEVERWDIYELELAGPSNGNPYVDVALDATFTRGEKTYRPQGFYDGDGTYKVRFMLGALDDWQYKTESNRAELDGKTGSFTTWPGSTDGLLFSWENYNSRKRLVGAREGVRIRGHPLEVLLSTSTPSLIPLEIPVTRVAHACP